MSTSPTAPAAVPADLPLSQERLPKHIPALDGVRGVAILLVMLCHYTVAPAGAPVEKVGAFAKGLFSITKFGWCGVDLFFVLSGFLITGILYDAKQSAHYFRNFYMRRVLRIFPVYFGLLAIVFLILLPLLHTTDAWGMRESSRNQGWLWLYGVNIIQAIKGAANVDDWVFGGRIQLHHFWSLAVEEHFYLVWPAVVFLCSRRVLIGICWGCIVGAFALRAGLAAAGVNELATCVLTPCRLDALAIGALLALVARGGGLRPLIRPFRWVAAVCAAILVGLFLWKGELDNTTRLVQIAGFSPLVFLAAAVIIGAATATPGTRIHRFWCSPSLQLLGKISYGLYVFHLPLDSFFGGYFNFSHYGKTVSPLLEVGLHGLASGLLAVGVAWLSWQLYEKHLLKLKRYFEK